MSEITIEDVRKRLKIAYENGSIKTMDQASVMVQKFLDNHDIHVNSSRSTKFFKQIHDVFNLEPKGGNMMLSLSDE